MARCALRRCPWADNATDARGGRDGFQIDFDSSITGSSFARTGERWNLCLVDDLSVAAFDERLHGTLRRSRHRRRDSRGAYGFPTTTPFPQDVDHATYDPDAVERFWRILDWTDAVFEDLRRLVLRQDEPRASLLALPRPCGHAVQRRAIPGAPALGAVDREAYSHDVVSFGFWAGDPTCASRRSTRMRPRSPTVSAHRRSARTTPTGPNGWRIAALLPYEASECPRSASTLLAFLESAYRAGAGLGGSDRRDLASTWCPPPRDSTASSALDGKPLDRNAIAGDLLALFGAELTTASATCAGCGARAPIAELTVYTSAIGTVRDAARAKPSSWCSSRGVTHPR